VAAEAPFRDAVMASVSLADTEAAEALKLAEDAPLATVAESGTVRAEALLYSATVRPADPAAPLRLTVHAVVAGVTSVCGEHDSEVNVGVVCVLEMLMLPPVPTTASAVPSGSAPAVFDIPIADGELAVGASVALTTATTPLGIVELAFDATQIIEPLAGLQLKFFPALVSEAPAVMLTEATVEGYVIFHWRLAGAVVALKDRFNETDPPGPAEPDARVNDCPYAARLLDSSRRVKTKKVLRDFLKKNVM
jgi:hypothetical protein